MKKQYAITVGIFALIVIGAIVIITTHTKKSSPLHQAAEAPKVVVNSTQNNFNMIGFSEGCMVGIDGCGNPFKVTPPFGRGVVGYSIKFPKGFRLVTNDISKFSEKFDEVSQLQSPYAELDDSEMVVNVFDLSLSGKYGLGCNSLSSCRPKITNNGSTQTITKLKVDSEDALLIEDPRPELEDFGYFDLLVIKNGYLYYINAWVDLQQESQYDDVVKNAIKSFRFLQ